MAELAQWLESEYRKKLNIDGVEGSKRYHQFMQMKKVTLSSIRRMGTAANLLYEFPAALEDVRMVRFKASRMIDGAKQSVVYAVAFWWEHTGLEYITTTPTHVSRDGEYRNRLIPVHVLESAYAEHAELIAPAEEAMLGDLASGKLKCDVTVLPTDEHEADILNQVDKKRLAVTAYVAGWLASWFDTTNGRFPAHSRPEYRDVVLNHHSSVAERIYRSQRSLLVELAGTMRRTKPVSEMRLEAGVKMIPFRSQAMSYPADIRFREWRELYINRIVSDYVANFAAPGFALIGAWFYFDGSCGAAYENEAMRVRYARSDEAAKALALLHEARYPARRSKTKPLDERIYEAAKYAQETVVMSKSAIGVITEHCGPAFGDLPNLIRRLEYPNYGDLETFANARIFAKTIFELLYNCQILHERIGAVHGDLHLGNFTRRRSVNLDQRIVPDDPDAGRVMRLQNAAVAFIIRDERSTYIFPYDGLQACLVDFSRSMLGGPAARAHIQREFGITFVDLFLTDQVPYAVSIIERHLPSYYTTHKEFLQRFAIDEPDIFYELARAADLLAIGRNLADTMEAEVADAAANAATKRPFAAAPGSIRLARSVEKRAREWLLNALHAVEAGDVVRPEDVTGAHGAFAAVLRAFDKWTFAAWKPADLAKLNLVDIHNAGVGAEYTLGSFSDWPPYVRDDEFAAHRGERTMADILSRDPQDYHNTVRRNAGVAEQRADMYPPDLTPDEFFAEAADDAAASDDADDADAADDDDVADGTEDADGSSSSEND